MTAADVQRRHEWSRPPSAWLPPQTLHTSVLFTASLRGHLAPCADAGSPDTVEETSSALCTVHLWGWGGGGSLQLLCKSGSTVSEVESFFFLFGGSGVWMNNSLRCLVSHYLETSLN